MPKQESIFKIKGSLGALSYYQLKGQYVVRRKRELPENYFEQAPSFAVVRANSSEFSGASRVSKSIRALFVPYSKNMADPYITGRLTALCRKIIGEGEGTLGERIFNIVLHSELLKGFAFEPGRDVLHVLNVRTTFACNAARNVVDMHIAAFAPKNCVKTPNGATHFQLICAIGGLSNFAYAGDGYAPVNAEQNGLKAVVESAVMPLGVALPSTTLTAALAGAPVLASDVALMVSVGIVFYEEVNGQFCVLEAGRAMNVVEVFG